MEQFDSSEEESSRVLEQQQRNDEQQCPSYAAEPEIYFGEGEGGAIVFRPLSYFPFPLIPSLPSLSTALKTRPSNRAEGFGGALLALSGRERHLQPPADTSLSSEYTKNAFVCGRGSAANKRIIWCT